MGEMTGEIKLKSPLDPLRHSAAHVMADAVLELFPEAKLAIGPPIEDGFYYDFDLPRPLTPEDLSRIEARMREIIAGDYPFIREEISKEEARRLFADQPYKLEILDEIPDEKVSIYRHGKFVDLCRGPHVESTGKIRAFKLLSVAGAYWRGDERRPMLQRIYGTAFETEEELQAYLKRLEEAARRDHRRLGRELDLFSIHHEEVGSGLILWHPKGGRVRELVEDLWRRLHREAGYELVYTPHIGRARLWEVSGHLETYRENMYDPIEVEGQKYYLKPMNCPFHIYIYKSRVRSYRELPIRLGELGTVYRYERSGVLHGLLRVRGFTQDDAHIFCRPDQIEAEIIGVLDLNFRLWEAFGFKEFEVYLATRPEKFVGRVEDWDRATEALKQALRDRGLDFKIDEGGGAFYGPKVDIWFRDAIGRAWQCTTVQLDFNLPERFDLKYTGPDGREHRPLMVHRALLGSMERFFGILIEHYAGAFPVWLAPVQAVIIPITDRHLEYAYQVEARLRAAGIRVDTDDRPDRMNQKIRDAQLQKVPYMLIVGDREVESGTVAVRLRSGEDLGPIPVDEFISRVRTEVTRYG